MKIRKFGLLMMLASLLPVLGSCSDEKIPGNEGQIVFYVSQEEPVIDITKSSVSDYTELPFEGDFDIVLTNSKDVVIYSGKLKDYATSDALVVGNYSVTATYGDVSDEGFDKPCFKGSQDFTVTGGSIQEVNINVKLVNSIIKVACTDAFKNYFTDYSFTVKTGNGNTISFPKDETRAAFVDAYTISVEGTLTNQAGKQQTFSKSYPNNLSEATCYTLKFDASNIGNGTITITFDDTTSDIDLGSVELNK